MKEISDEVQEDFHWIFYSYAFCHGYVISSIGLFWFIRVASLALGIICFPYWWCDPDMSQMNQCQTKLKDNKQRTRVNCKRINIYLRFCQYQEVCSTIRVYIRYLFDDISRAFVHLTQQCSQDGGFSRTHRPHHTCQGALRTFKRYATDKEYQDSVCASKICAEPRFCGASFRLVTNRFYSCIST